MEGIKSYGGYRAGVEPLESYGKKDKQSPKNRRNKMIKKRFDLQLFAEEGAEGGAAEPGQEQGTENGQEQGGTESGAEGDKKYSDADVDAIVKKRLERERADYAKAIEEAKAEAEKLAKMNEEQKQQYELEKQQEENKKLQEENAKLKAEAAKAELAKTAADILQKSDIDATPAVLGLVVGSDAEQTKAKIDAFVKAVEDQVKKAEVARATGTTPRYITNNPEPKSEIEKRIAKYNV